jgi:DNA-binding transcriptional MerR regulator
MLPPTDPLDLAELSARADVSVRTIRFYIQQGLLPSPESRGPGAHYTAEHLDRLRLIKRLQREHLPLAEIRRRLEGLGAAEIARLAEETAARPRSSARDYIRQALSEPGAKLRAAEPDLSSFAAPMMAMAPPAAGMVRDVAKPMEPAKPRPPARSQWERITLAPDVELHLRRPLSREQNRQVERLMEAARVIFEEDAP